MAKKQVSVSLRKPPRADLDAFVAGVSKPEAPSSTRLVEAQPAAEEPAPSSVAAASPEPQPVPEEQARVQVVVTGTDGRVARQFVIALPEEVLTRLSLYCAEHDRDMGNVMAELVSRHLDTLGERPDGVAAVIRWIRSGLQVIATWRSYRWAL